MPATAVAVPVTAGSTVVIARVTVTASAAKFADCGLWLRNLDALMDGAHWSEVFGDGFDGARNAEAAIETAEQYVADAFAALLGHRPR